VLILKIGGGGPVTPSKVAKLTKMKGNYKENW